MGKPRAEIQKEYRERKKEKEGLDYLERERNRVKKYYVPINERSRKDRITRREKVRCYVQEHRNRKRAPEKHPEQSHVETMEVDDNETRSRLPTEGLRIKFPFFDPRMRARKRISRATSRNWREIQKLKAENESLRKRVSTFQKRCQRLKKTKVESRISENPGHESGDSNQTFTPRKRVATELREAGVSPSKIPKTIKDKLLFNHVVTDEIKAARKSMGVKGTRVIANVLTGKIVRKYNMKSMLSKYTGVHRNTLNKANKKVDKFPDIRKKQKERDQLKDEVCKFLLRDDNSRLMPGKNDKIKEDKCHTQKRVLNDSLKFLHLKFSSESQHQLSFSTFCRLRPKSVSPTRYISRQQCLCLKHQNMALTLKSMKSAGAKVPNNPDEYLRKLEERGSPNDFIDGLVT